MGEWEWREGDDGQKAGAGDSGPALVFSEISRSPCHTVIGA